MARPLSGWIALALALVLGGCTAQQAPPARTAGGDACRAGRLRAYQGVPLTADTLARITAAASGVQNVRTIRPGDAVTMDYRVDRLNVELDEAGRITRLRCG